MTRRKTLVLMGAIFALSVQPAEADAARTHSFEGSCAVIGVAKVSNPLTLVPTPNYVVYRASGRCNGTLDGRRLPETGAPVAYFASGPKVTSCTSTVVRVTAMLTFSPGHGRAAKAIRLSGEFVLGGRNGGGLIRGARSGVATVSITVQGGPETLQACAAGTLRKTVMSGELLTVGRLVG